MKSVVIGHSWVKRLQNLDLLPVDFILVGHGGATFTSLTESLDRLEPDVSVRRVFIFAGSNDIDSAKGTAGVNDVFETCLRFRECVTRKFPRATIIQAQVEDRFAVRRHCQSWQVRLDFKRKSNKFNKWLLKHSPKNCLFVLKGANGFSDPHLYDRQGIHLNREGNLRLVEKIMNFV